MFALEEHRVSNKLIDDFDALMRQFNVPVKDQFVEDNLRLQPDIDGDIFTGHDQIGRRALCMRLRITTSPGAFGSYCMTDRFVVFQRYLSIPDKLTFSNNYNGCFTDIFEDDLDPLIRLLSGKHIHRCAGERLVLIEPAFKLQVH